MLDPQRRGIDTLEKYKLPYFITDDGIKIWGLTAYIADMALRNIITPALED